MSFFRAGPLSFLDCDGIRLMLSPPEAPEFDLPGSVLYFRVPDIRAAHRELAERGVVFAGAPHLIARMSDHELWMAFSKTRKATRSPSTV